MRVLGQILKSSVSGVGRSDERYIRDGAIKALYEDTGPVLSEQLWKKLEITNNLTGLFRLKIPT
jgi:hypothetical protein